jgi:hypothetical protein
MSSEWMKVMLDEIARKQAEGAAERLELERRRGEVAHGGQRVDETPDGGESSAQSGAAASRGTPGVRTSG